MTIRLDLDVPVGKCGEWRIEQRVINGDERMSKIRALMNGDGRYVPNGTYTGLWRGNTIVMSNTPDEIRDHGVLKYAARLYGGHALINGLGLGVALELIMPFVEHVTVIERSPEVIELSGKHYLNKFAGKIAIIEADAFEYQPPKGQKYSIVWHDIWDTIGAANLPEMTRLHRKYGRRCAWQESWCKWLCQRQKRGAR